MTKKTIDRSSHGDSGVHPAFRPSAAKDLIRIPAPDFRGLFFLQEVTPSLYLPQLPVPVRAQAMEGSSFRDAESSLDSRSSRYYSQQFPGDCDNDMNSRKRPFSESDLPQRPFDDDDDEPEEDLDNSGGAINVLQKRSRRSPSDSEISSSPDQEEAMVDNDDIWTEEFHRSFVEAVYDAGVKSASPSVILENMVSQESVLSVVTSERCKSHLQKYRNNRQKSKAEFLQEYDSFMTKALAAAGAAASKTNTGHQSATSTKRTGCVANPNVVVEMMGMKKLLGGEAAAFLSYSVMAEEENELAIRRGAKLGVASAPPDGITPDHILQHGSDQYAKFMLSAAGSSTRIPFPTLTDEEQKSPLGMSLSHVMALFYSLSQYLRNERLKNQQPSTKCVSVAGMQDTSTDLPASSKTMQQTIQEPLERRSSLSRSTVAAASFANHSHQNMTMVPFRQQPLFPQQQQQQQSYTRYHGVSQDYSIHERQPQEHVDNEDYDHDQTSLSNNSFHGN